MRYRYVPDRPLTVQLAEAAAVCRDPTTQGLFMVVADGLNLRIETYYHSPTGAHLSDLIGWWTRAVKLLESTPVPNSTAQEGA